MSQRHIMFLASAALLLAAFSILVSVVLFAPQAQDDKERAAQTKVTRTNRVQTVSLICDQGRILVRFIEAPPDLPRDAPALRALRAERRDDILDQAKRLQELPVVKP